MDARAQSAKRMEAEGVPSGVLYCGDILKDSAALERSLEGADALVIATSAVPQIKPLSIAKVRRSCSSSPPCMTGLHGVLRACAVC